MAAATKINPNSTKPLIELLLVQLSDIGGLPNWAIRKCNKHGVKTVADLYRFIYLAGSHSGIGAKFVALAEKILMDLGLVDRIGLRDPLLAAACDAGVRMAHIVEEGIPQRLAEHEASVLANCDRKLAESEFFYRNKIDRVVENFRRREQVLIGTLKDATREKFTFIAPDVSPESVSRWLSFQVAGRVPDGFEFAADLKYVIGSGLGFIRRVDIHLSVVNLANLLVVFEERQDKMLSCQGRFAPPGSKIGHGVEGIESTINAQFVARGGGRLAMLRGSVIIDGMSGDEINDLFKSSDSE
jgi:hypothetical protein